MSDRISVVIPTYNEANNLSKLVAALLALPLNLDVLVVDDDSPDGTGRIANHLAAAHPGRVDVLHRKGKLGLRSAYLQGFEKVLAGGASAIVQMDGDFSHDPRELTVLVKALKSADVVFGSRYCAGGSVDKRWPTWRKALSAFGNLYVRAILGVKVRDATTGFRVWRRDTLLQMPLDRIQANGYVFLVEMAYLAGCLEFRIAESPIHFADRRWGTSKMSLAIQCEAAARVWQVWWDYRDVRRMGRSARLRAVFLAQ